MTSTFTKISLVTVFATVAFGVVGYMTQTHLFISDADALGTSGCADCGSPSNPGPETDGGNDTPPPATPVCNLSLNVTEVDSIGDSYRLTWSGTPSSASFFINGAAVSASGHANFTFNGPNYDRFRMVGNNGGVTCEANVQVNRKPAPVPAPVCTLSANPTYINRGNSSTLTWTSQNAVSASLNQSIGSVSVNGNRSVSPSNTTTYTLTVKNSAGVEATCATTVTVKDIPPPAAPVCDISANPTQITRGNSSTLTWTSQNAVSASLNQSIGSVSVNGNRSVAPTNTTTYTLTVTNSAGVSATCATTVTVNDVPPPPVFTCSNNVSFNVSPTSIRRGNSATLSWSVNGADTVRFDQGISATTLSGSVTVSPASDTTYRLIAKKGDTEISCPVTLNITTGGGGGGGGYVIPTCDLTASKRSVTAGEAVTLRWTSANATEVEIRDNFRVTYITTDGKTNSQKRALYNGSVEVKPTKKTTYTLAIENNNGRKRTCEVTVDVATFPVTQIRDQQPVVTGIVLSQVPQTGFEAGPTLTALFYTLLVLWALYLAYYFVIRPKLATAPVVEPSTITPTFPVDHSETHPHMFVAQVTTPTMVTPVAPVPIPVAPIGYATPATSEVAVIEQQAHAAHILMSGVALDYFMATTQGTDRTARMDQVIATAKASFPSEGGWVVLNEERMKQVLG